MINKKKYDWIMLCCYNNNKFHNMNFFMVLYDKKTYHNEKVSAHILRSNANWFWGPWKRHGTTITRTEAAQAYKHMECEINHCW